MNGGNKIVNCCLGSKRFLQLVPAAGGDVLSKTTDFSPSEEQKTQWIRHSLSYTPSAGEENLTFKNVYAVKPMNNPEDFNGPEVAAMRIATAKNTVAGQEKNINIQYESSI
ncbi:MAG: hypothetical protein KAS71_15400 [Bacteroidales bacterium]|nr:hypothetical protein [Bacteroidales bacterium]